MENTAKSILGELDLVVTKNTNTEDKTSYRRRKLIEKLEEQKHVVEAVLNGTEYFSKKLVKQTDEDGNTTKVTVPKRVAKWFYTNNGNEWLMEVKYGNRALQLAQNKTSIAIGALDNMVAVIDKVKEAVTAGELDKAIAAVSQRKSK